MIEYALRAALVATTAVTDLVGSGDAARIWPIQVPQDAQYPAISFQRISGAPEYDQEGAAGAARARVQFDCWAADDPDTDGYDTMCQLAEAVRGALSALTGTYASVAVQSCFLSQRRALYDASARLYRESMDFTVIYAES